MRFGRREERGGEFCALDAGESLLPCAPRAEAMEHYISEWFMMGLRYDQYTDEIQHSYGGRSQYNIC